MMNKYNTVLFIALTLFITFTSTNEYFIGMTWGVTLYVLYLKLKTLWLDSDQKNEEI